MSFFILPLSKLAYDVMYLINVPVCITSFAARSLLWLRKMESKSANAAVLYESHDEIKEPIEAKVTGEIPSWLNGTLIRNGPGKFEFGDTSFNHWFDGQALLHRFTIKDGKVEYFNKFLRSNAFLQNTKHNRIMLSEFGTNQLPDPCKNIFDRYFSYFSGGDITDNALVNIVRMKNKIYATTETPIMTEIDPTNLDVLNRVDNSKDFPGPSSLDSSIAHPHEDPDGTFYNCGISRGRNTKYNIYMVPPKSQEDPNEKALNGGKVLCSIPVHSGEAYVHSFGITENYIILLENPFMLSVPKVLSRMFFGWSFAECFYWDPSQLSRFHVIEKKSGKRVGVYTTKPMFVFHHVNAYESDDEIVVDVVAFPDATIVKELYLHELRSHAESAESKAFQVSELRRYRLPINKSKVLDDSIESHALISGYEVLCDETVELPRIHYEDYNGKPYTFAYALTTSQTGKALLESVVKINTKTKESKVWGGPGLVASEPVFVAMPGAKQEDEGVVLSVVIDVNEKKTFLLVLDGESFSEVGRAEVPFTTPFGLHGRFVADQNL